MESDEKVIVIASDAALRRSLAFLLETEGYAVVSHETVDGAAAGSLTRYGCAVVDEGCIEEGPDAWHRLGEIADTIILLFGTAREAPRGIDFHAVEKPFLGEKLLAAVKVALGQAKLRSST